MTSQTLRDARRYEEAMAQNITDQERPEFHLSPRVGWMNDPNGFSYYKDKFHLYYQYYPYDSQWGPMHWGHVVTMISFIGSTCLQLLHRTCRTIMWDVSPEVL